MQHCSFDGEQDWYSIFHLLLLNTKYEQSAFVNYEEFISSVYSLKQTSSPRPYEAMSLDRRSSLNNNLKKQEPTCFLKFEFLSIVMQIPRYYLIVIAACL